MTSYSEKRTTTTKTTAYTPEVKRTSAVYHSAITPRTSLGTNAAMTPNFSSGSSGRSYVISSEYSYGSSSAPTKGSTEVAVVKTSREKEKKDMRDLNERLANYIEKVRFLEAQNRKLASELEELRNKWGRETANIRQMYETELVEARKVLDDTAKEKSSVEIRVKSLEEQNQDLQRQLDEAKHYHQIDREQINKLNQQLSEYDGEISLLRRNLETMEKDRDRDQLTIKRLTEEVEKLRNALNNMTLAQLDAENRRQTLSEEMDFLKSVHDEEMKELAALAYRDTTEENREFWKTELSQAIKDIQNEFDMKTDGIRSDLEAYYNLKVQEFKTGYTKQNMETTHAREETKKFRQQAGDLKGKIADLEARNAQLDQRYQKLLREFEDKDQEHAIEMGSMKDEISTLRAEMERILVELQTLLDAKLSLELEIAAYRKLLEVEENRSSKAEAAMTASMKSDGNADDAMLREVSSNLLASAGGDGGVSASSGGGGGYYSSFSASGGGSKSMSASGGGSMAFSSSTVESSSSFSSGGSSATIKGDAKSADAVDSGSADDSQMAMKMMRGEVSARTTSQRTVKGPIAISDISSEGKYITLENKGTSKVVKDEQLDGWKLVRQLDGTNSVTYTFGKYTLPANKTITIYAKGSSKLATTKDLILDKDDSWGVGSHVVTTLYNEKDEERASTIQNTIYQ